MPDKLETAGLIFSKKFSLKPSGLTILYGKNGSGKTSVITAFELLNTIALRNLEAWTTLRKNPDTLFHNGISFTSEIMLCYMKKDESYRCVLHLKEGRLVLKQERLVVHSRKYANEFDTIEVKDTALESIFGVPLGDIDPDVYPIISSMSSWWIGRINLSAIRNPSEHDTGKHLYPNGGNLIPYLLSLRENSSEAFETLTLAVKTVCPEFVAFAEVSQNKIPELLWESASTSVLSPFSRFSDGTLRFICYAALFVSPNLPELIAIDDIETGLDMAHQKVLMQLAVLASEKTTLLLTTHSELIADTKGANLIDPTHIKLS